MIVVSDTSPLNYLILIDAIDVLPKLFEHVHAPFMVLQELSRLETPPRVKAWAAAPPPWFHTSSPSTSILTTTLLDPGEMDALALAKELGINTVLMDERKGRRVAREQGLATLGTLTILELAAREKLITLKPALARLQGTNFRISAGLIKAALERDGQRTSM